MQSFIQGQNMYRAALHFGIILFGMVSAAPFCWADEDNTPVRADTSNAWLLHLPGIAGNSGIDRAMIRGLRQGGYDGEIETYDWTGTNPGIAALLGRKHNEEEAKKIADLIVAHARAHPDGHILLTSHSGGTGLAVWALEALPDDVKVDTLLLLSSALSPNYDLSKALSHVRGKAYAYTSPNDFFVLGVGTGLLGTIDGKKCDAAGKGGFIKPEQADAPLYDKLVQRPYDPAWMKYGNIGDHIGTMSTRFAAAMLTPIVMETLPPLAGATTQPVRQGSQQAATRPAVVVSAKSPATTHPAADDSCDCEMCKPTPQLKVGLPQTQPASTRPVVAPATGN